MHAFQDTLGLAHRVFEEASGPACHTLAQLGFDQPYQALRRLDLLVDLAGPAYALEPPVSLLAAVSQSVQPDQALRRLERFLQKTGGITVLHQRTNDAPILGQQLAQILGYSGFLTDVLMRAPAHLYWLLVETAHLSQPLALSALRHALIQETADDDPLTGLYRFQRRELLRLGAAQVLGVKDVRQVGRELADLADAIVDQALKWAWEELLPRWGRPLDQCGRPAKFCVVALGKYGGQELNYSSDIDLLFIYDEEGQTRAPRRGYSVDNGQFFRRLGEHLIQLLTAMTGEGFFYRVDMRLRPDGADGALVRSLASYLSYYEDRGELWERQMLTKARRAAGSTQIWQRFRQMLVPFVFPGHFPVSPRQEIARVKQRIEAEIASRAGDNNIKLQPGGIRDIEFIVQCLQLLNGHTHPQIRAHNTLTAIEHLRRAKLLAFEDAHTLKAAYCFLRQLENLLQIQEAQPVYAVPEEEEARQILTELMELDEPLEAVLAEHCQGVRRLYDAVFS